MTNVSWQTIGRRWPNLYLRYVALPEARHSFIQLTRAVNNLDASTKKATAAVQGFMAVAPRRTVRG